jgi:hypothetical protein
MAAVARATSGVPKRFNYLKTPITYENKTNSSHNLNRGGEFQRICGVGSDAWRRRNGDALVGRPGDGALKLKVHLDISIQSV